MSWKVLLKWLCKITWISISVACLSARAHKYLEKNFLSILLIIADIILRVYENSFLTFIFKIFYQSIIALQCCISFCYTTKLISCMYTYVPSFLNLPPISPAPPNKKKTHFIASLVVQMVNNLSAMQETWVQSLGWDNPLKKEMATLSCILA